MQVDREVLPCDQTFPLHLHLPHPSQHDRANRLDDPLVDPPPATQVKKDAAFLPPHPSSCFSWLVTALAHAYTHVPSSLSEQLEARYNLFNPPHPRPSTSLLLLLLLLPVSRSRQRSVELGDWVVGGDFSVGEEGDMGDLRAEEELKLMGHQDDPNSPPQHPLDRILPDRIARLCVYSREHVVEEDNSGVGVDGAGKSKTRLLSSRQLHARPPYPRCIPVDHVSNVLGHLGPAHGVAVPLFLELESEEHVGSDAVVEDEGDLTNKRSFARQLQLQRTRGFGSGHEREQR
eukprot:751861-Hanusia_phi.AAC.1